LVWLFFIYNKEFIQKKKMIQLYMQKMIWTSSESPSANSETPNHAFALEGMGHGAYGMRGRERRVFVHNDVATLSGALDSNISNYGSQEEEDGNMVVEDFNGVRHLYRDETWSQKHFTYSPKPMDFIGRRGTTQYFHHVPSPLHLFQLFWTDDMLNKIVVETN
jgi:hypothetical protein